MKIQESLNDLVDFFLKKKVGKTDFRMQHPLMIIIEYFKGFLIKHFLSEFFRYDKLSFGKGCTWKGVK